MANFWIMDPGMALERLGFRSVLNYFSTSNLTGTALQRICQTLRCSSAQDWVVVNQHRKLHPTLACLPDSWLLQCSGLGGREQASEAPEVPARLSAAPVLRTGWSPTHINVSVCSMVVLWFWLSVLVRPPRGKLTVHVASPAPTQRWVRGWSGRAPKVGSQNSQTQSWVLLTKNCRQGRPNTSLNKSIQNWSGVGPELVRSWSGVGPELVRSGSKLVRSWSGGGEVQF